jgi:peptide-methionine (S)-S-oxide reductase
MRVMTHRANILLSAFSLCFLVVGCGSPSTADAERVSSPAPSTAGLPQNVSAENRAVAVFAGGCFWCMEKPFDQIPGVIATISGYTGGLVNDPTYELVSGGVTGHYEAVEVTYDKSRITYQQLLDTYWRQVDPFDARGQFCDKGNMYEAVIFPANSEETAAAQASKASVEAQFPGQTITVKILPAKRFWPAEEYHQDYYQKNPIRYAYYRNGCGRDARLRAVWGAPVN